MLCLSLVCWWLWLASALAGSMAVAQRASTLLLRLSFKTSTNNLTSVIVATGLITLVDDCIRRRWHHERRGSRILPSGSALSRSLERMGPRRLIGEVLQRRGST